MTSSLARSLDALAEWRRAVDRRVDQLTRMLSEHDLLDAESSAQADALRQRLAGDKLIVAFVAEFSRGKSELINAIFFADAGRRILPATPGRTTMCPVELAWDAEEPATLALLPLDTRLGGQPVAQLRQMHNLWRRVPLTLGDPAQLAAALGEVTRTTHVTVDHAKDLGLWNDDHPEDNPPRDNDGKVEVPAWRHALINYPHPLLKRGMVVIDTPGLNAIGAEPELTLSLLPSAHAIVFLLGADTGVTKSDLTIWRDHLGDASLERFVALNKIDTLADPLIGIDEVQAQIMRQCDQVAMTLDVPRRRVFPLSARDALAARVAGDDAVIGATGLPELEHALSTQLMPRHSALLGRIAVEGATALQKQAERRLTDRRRQLAEQILDLRGLRGKSGAKLDSLVQRCEAEGADFERCALRLAALRAVHSRHLRDAISTLSADRLRSEIGQMQRDSDATLFKLGAGKAFAALGERLRELLTSAAARNGEIEKMLSGTFQQLNSEFGFALITAPPPELDRHMDELGRIISSYSRYFGISNAWRLSERGFMDRFMRMLLSKLRVVYESAAGDIELWNKSVSLQLEGQLRERRLGFKRRRESMQRVQSASGELERRIVEVETQDDRERQWVDRIESLISELRTLAMQPPLVGDIEATMAGPRLALVHDTTEIPRTVGTSA